MTPSTQERPTVKPEHVLPSSIVLVVGVLSAVYTAVGYIVMQAYIGDPVHPFTAKAGLVVVILVFVTIQTFVATQRAIHPVRSFLIICVLMLATLLLLQSRTFAHTPLYILAVVSISSHTRGRKRVLLLLIAVLSDLLGQSILLTTPTAEMPEDPAAAIASELVNVFLTYAIYLVIGLVVAGYRSRLFRMHSEFTTLELEHRQRTEAAIASERRRMARELHDVTAHHLAAIAIQSKAVNKIYDGDSIEMRDMLQSMASDATKSLESLRQIVGILRIESSDQTAPQPMLMDIPTLVDSFRSRIPDVRLNMQGELTKLPDVIQLACYRIIEESLSNAAKHAPGALVLATINHESGRVFFCVRNENSEHDPARRDQGFGLIGMKERVDLLGGNISTGIFGEGGWRVEGFIPTEENP